MKGRRFKTKVRGKATRERKRLLLFSAEGHNKTERLYLKDMRFDYGISVQKTRDTKTDPVGMAESLIAEMDSKGFSREHGDIAVCLIDSDCDKNKDRQIASAENIAKKHGIALIVSNPCFEIWYICHFTDHPGPCHSSQIAKKALSRYVQGYEESTEGMYAMLKDRINIAISNAKILEDRCRKAGYSLHTSDFFPSTEVFKLIRLIKKEVSDSSK